ncbi:MAG: type I restriction-modification enzyme R subunit C-terminal domain-containing protein, partial [Sciscionella sp.]
QRWVRTYRERKAWDTLDETALTEIGEHLSDLPSRVRDEDEEAKRFDLLMLHAQLCVLNAEPGFTRIRDRVRDIADRLLEQTSVPAIRQQQELLDALAEETWWSEVTLPMLEHARQRVRSLVRLLDRRSRKPVYTDFDDTLGEATEITMTAASAPVDLRRFRAKARDFLRRHENHIALHKLRRNAELTEADLTELHRMLTDSGEFDTDTLSHAAAEAHGLGLFVRSLVGLDREAAVAALSDFLTDTTLRANQIEFVNMIVEHLTRNGAMTADQLYEPPFTDLAPRGPDAVFPSERLDALVAILHHVRNRATAAS